MNGPFGGQRRWLPMTGVSERACLRKLRGDKAELEELAGGSIVYVFHAGEMK